MDQQEFSLAHLTVLSCPPPEMIYLAARAGYRFVSPRPIPMHYPGEPAYDLAHDAALLRRTTAALSATGLGVHDIELCRVYAGMDPRDYEPAFEVAARLGARHAISSIWTPDRAYYLDMFDQVCAVAAPYGIRVNLEYVPIAEVSTLAGAVDVLRSVDATNTGLMLDTYHVHRARTNLADLDAVPREWFHFCQLSDAPEQIPEGRDEVRRELRERRLYVGEGGIDIAGLLHRLPPMVYSLELPNLARSGEFGAAEHAARCLESAIAYLARHPRPVAA
jgi:sugar phosphate isomerase/epimerase